MEESGQFDFEALDEDNEQEADQVKDRDDDVADGRDDEDSMDGKSFGSLKPQYIDVLSDWVSLVSVEWCWHSGTLLHERT